MPLPVTLSSFTATRHADGGVAVRWSTATETNNAYFEVQHAAAEQAFRTVAKVPGQGQSTRTHTYAVQHRPAAGLNYYRLRQVDADGTATFSPVVAVASAQELSLYPNPAHTQLTLVAPTGATSYRVRNMLGEVLLQGTISAGPVLLEVSQLPNSIYQVEVLSAAERTTCKFVKE
nr:T9SS type A sorting domain-containing protein [Hymenobacter telluris]